MSIPEQAKSQLIRLIDEAESLDPSDLEAFLRWLRDSYEALGFDPLQQQRYEEYCRTSWGTTPATKLRMGVRILKQALAKESPE